jgi:predicted PurR-regulated permease PerM
MLDFPDPQDRRPTQITPAETPGLRGLLTVAVAVIVVAGLYLGRTVLIPITLAVLLSFLLAPLVNLLRRIHLGRVPSVLLAMLLALAVILAIGGLIGTQVAGLAQDIPRYVSTIEQKVDTVQRLVLSRVAAVTRALVRLPTAVNVTGNTGPNTASTGPANPGTSAAGALSAAPPSGALSAAPPAGALSAAPPTGALSAAPPTADARKPIAVEVHQPDPTMVQLLQNIITPVVAPLSTTAIVMIISIFILLQREDLRDRMIRLFGSSDLHRTTVAMNDAARRLSRYLLTQLVVNAAFGAIIAAGLALIGIPSPIIWGVLGALLRFVPYIGAPLAAVMPLALAAAIDTGWSTLLWTTALYVVVEPLMAQGLEPLLYGHSTGLSPFAVVLAATFWTWLWGPIGLILSTPVTLCLMVLGRHVARLEFFDVLLGDRPALTPVESFYQRMLAGDPDEAHDQAEILLKQRPLWSYYDEVALEGLRLAVIDAERGVLTAAHLERIKLCVQSLIEDLDDHEDREPRRAPVEVAIATASRAEPPRAEPPNVEPAGAEPAGAERAGVHPPRTRPPSADLNVLDRPAVDVPAADSLTIAPARRDATTVLCIAGRGILDEAVSTMLAQLLEKRGLESRVVPHAATTRAAIGKLEVGGVALACISYLELSGNPSHLRYLLRRLRRRLPPNVPVLVGLWPAGEPIHQDERLRTAVGADYYTSSLHEAVEACLEAAHKAPMDEQPPAAMTPALP